MEIEFTTHFLKKAKRLSFGEQKKLSQRVEILKKSPFDPRLKTHMLSGNLKGQFSFSLDHSKRVVFVLNQEVVIFIDVGSHDDVYR